MCSVSSLPYSPGQENPQCYQWNEAHVHFQQELRQQIEQADRHRWDNPEYNSGQWVWLSNHDLRLWLPCKKTQSDVCGSVQYRQITPVSFSLALSPTYHISPTLHVSLLKVVREGRQRRPATRVPHPSLWTVRRPIRYGISWTPDVEVDNTSPHGLGGVWPRRTILGQFRLYPRPHTHC